MDLFTLEHPATLLPSRSPELRDVFHTDFRRIVKLLSGFRPNYQDRFTIVQKSSDLLDFFVQAPTSIALDLETGRDGRPDMVGLASSADEAILLPLPSPWFGLLLSNLAGKEVIVHYGEGLEVEWFFSHSGYAKALPFVVHDLHKLFHAYDPEYANAAESGSGSLAFIQSLYSWRPYHKHLLRAAHAIKNPVQAFQAKAHYCMRDCVVEWECFHRLRAACERELPDAWTAYLRDALPLLQVMVRSRVKGWHVERAQFESRRDALRLESAAKAGAVLAKYPGIAPKGKHPRTAISLAALKTTLAQQGVRLPRTAKGNFTFDRKTRQALCKKYPDLRLVEAYFETQDILSDCYNPKIIGADDRVHAQASGFLTSWRWRYTNPNLAQRPPTERFVFTASPARTLVIVDTSAGEYRYFAGLSRDRKLADIFQRYDQTHRATDHPHVCNAALLFGTTPGVAALWKKEDHLEHRRYVFAKNYIYRLMYSYRGGIDALRDAAAKSGLALSRVDIARLDAVWGQSFPLAARWREEQVQKARQSRQVWCEQWGYVRKLHGEVDNVALNHPMQAGIAGLINRAIIRAWDQYRLLPLVNMHDGIVWEVPEAEAAEWAPRLAALTEGEVNGVKIPVDVTVRRTWGPPPDVSVVFDALGKLG